MALGKRSSSFKSKRVVAAADEEFDFGIACGYGRKRTVISCDEETSSMDLTPKKAPLKRRCGVCMTVVDAEISSLESLPQDILIRILCGVNHDDLKQLVQVSKAISEATLIAKQCHFAYSTPSKVHAFRTAIDFEDFCEDNEIEAPIPPPPPRRFRSPLNRKKLADISVALFTSQ